MEGLFRIIYQRPWQVIGETVVLAGMFGIFWVLAVFGHAVMGG